MAVRTTTLAAAIVGTVDTTIYTCPAGKTCIVKNVLTSKFGTPAQTLTIRIRRTPNAWGLLLASHGIGAQVQSFNLYAVLHPGDTLGAIVDTGTMPVWISGAELIGVAN